MSEQYRGGLPPQTPGYLQQQQQQQQPAAGPSTYPPAYPTYPVVQLGFDSNRYPVAAGDFSQTQPPPPPPGFNPNYVGYAAQPPPYTEYPNAAVTAQEQRPNDKFPTNQSSDMFATSFSEKTIRMAFIRKVYLILMCQLLVTVGLIALVLFEENTKNFVRRNSWLYFVSYGIFLVTYLVLACCPSIRRKHPMNIVMLCIFTVALSYMVAMISSYHKTDVVFYSMGICAVVCFGITIFAIQTKFDFTLCGSFLFISVLILFLFGIFAIIYQNKVVHLIYSALLALLFSLFLAYDTQMIVGGRRHEMSPEEYVFGALQLYLDIIYIFVAILNIFGSSK